jgi:hypothetical protein
VVTSYESVVRRLGGPFESGNVLGVLLGVVAIAKTLRAIVFSCS